MENKYNHGIYIYYIVMFYHFYSIENKKKINEKNLKKCNSVLYAKVSHQWKLNLNTIN